MEQDPTKKDKELIDYYLKTGDLFFLGELFERYTHLIYAVCLKYLKNETECKDAIMDIFEKISSELKEKNVNNFKNWLYTITKNYCLQHLRTNQLHQRIEEKYLHEQKSLLKSANPEELLVAKEESTKNEALKASILQLNKEQRICIELMYFEDKSYKEISDITGYELKKVKSYIQNGKRNLKNLLSTQND